MRGGGSKAFYGGAVEGATVSTAALAGIVDYAPTELVITARAGTPLAALEATMAGERQMLAFEPPRFDGGGTLGGAIATGLSGPRRPYAVRRATSCWACASSTAPASPSRSAAA